MDRRMGYLNQTKKFIRGEARDVETIARLRPWIEDEYRVMHGNFKKTDLFTDYDAVADIFKFKIVFHK